MSWISWGGVHRVVRRLGDAVRVDGPSTAEPSTASSPIGDWLRARQRHYAPFLEQGRVGNRRLVFALGLLLGVAAVLGLPELLAAFPLGTDVEIPLRAAERWSAGGQPYPPSAMLALRGADLPYLYPPFLLPLIAPFSRLPHDLVSAAWMGVIILAAAWACRRLGMPWLVVPFALAWPPFAEALITGNVQVIGFAAFVALFYAPGAVGLVQRDLVPGRDVVHGLQAAVVGLFKPTQLLPVLYMARRRLRAAGVAVLAVVALAVAMAPLTGIGVYGDWLAQLARANDPTWWQGGLRLSTMFGIPALATTLAGLAVAVLARGRDSAAWLGLALIVSAPSIHGYGFLFILPALMTLRRDLAIPLAAMFLGNYHGYSWWLCLLVVCYLLIASARWTWLRASAGGAALSLPGAARGE